MTIAAALATTVANWERIGAPALMERFVLRNGKAFAPGPRRGPRRKRHQCFKNATDFVCNGGGGTYVEGYTMIGDLPVFIHHAWVTFDGETAMDPTLVDTGDHQYFGIEIPKDALIAAIMETERYGVLDHGLGLNTAFMFGRDPDLEPIVRGIMEKGPWLAQ